MWGFLTVLVLSTAVLTAMYLLLRESRMEDGFVDTQESDRILAFAECEGEHHGPTSLGGVIHQTCLRRSNGGELFMWCHTHAQGWDNCIAKFTGGN